MTVTTKKILARIACPKLDLVKGSGYFYFVYDDEAAGKYDTHSVYVNALGHLDLDRWVEEGKDFAAKFA